jgi:predicted alpha/beta superfamily hydrolase
MIRLSVFILVIVFTASAFADEPQKTSTIKIGDRYNFHSKILDEKQAFNVSLPRSYYRADNKNKRYPVLYILDGYKNTFHMVSGLTEKLSRSNNSTSDVPELIIVALPSNNRFRDYTPTRLLKEHYGANAPDWFDATGGANTYLNMLTNEILPYIDKTFRTTDDRTFAGHSLGGLLVLHDLIRENSLFNRYIAVDASWWYDNRLMERNISKLGFLDGEHIRLFMALAGTNDKNHSTAAISFEQTLKGKKFLNLTHTLQKFPSENHNSIDLQGYYNGLKWVFDGYEISKE